MPEVTREEFDALKARVGRLEGKPDAAPQTVLSYGPGGSEELSDLTALVAELDKAGVSDAIRAQAEIGPSGMTLYAMTKSSYEAAKVIGDADAEVQQERNLNDLANSVSAQQLSGGSDEAQKMLREGSYYTQAYEFIYKPIRPGHTMMTWQRGKQYPNVIRFPSGGIGREGVVAAVRANLERIVPFWSDPSRS